ncbi:MAG: LptF/LptG family permease [Phycisphaeraceae bacterium]|nr:LptF/LptG family permease [Phycisphaeraceae bacterium]
MARPQPISLWTSIFGELTRNLLLATAVLVTVIAFAATIKPLADGRLAPFEAMKFLLLAIPPMLAYALPFAGCFASTLVYHRLSSDNEFVAAAAGGVSHRSLLVPAAVLGVILFGGMLLLNAQIIPRFLVTMQNMITEDVAKLLATRINRGQSVELRKLLVFADRAQPIELEPGSEARTALVLARPTVIERDEDGNVVSEGSAGRATLWVYPETSNADSGTTTRIAMRFEEFASKDANTGLVTGRALQHEITVPSSLSDDPKFLRSDELRQLRTKPERMSWIDIRRRRLADELALRRALDDMGRSLSAAGSFTLLDAAGRQVVVRAASIKPGNNRTWNILPKNGGNVEIDVLRPEGNGLSRTGGVRHIAKSVVLAPDTSDDRPAGEMALRLELRDVASSPLDNSAATESTKRERVPLAGLSAPKDQLASLLKLSTLPLLAEAASAESDPNVADRAGDLRNLIAYLQDEITSRQHERYAVAASCLVMMLTGAVTALRFSRSLPLTVYLWSFFPALVCVITISGGQQFARSSGWIGLPLLWAGVGVLALYTFWTYLIVRRH